jgi:hypothetical protein
MNESAGSSALVDESELKNQNRTAKNDEPYLAEQSACIERTTFVGATRPAVQSTSSRYSGSENGIERVCAMLQCSDDSMLRTH